MRMSRAQYSPGTSGGPSTRPPGGLAQDDSEEGRAAQDDSEDLEFAQAESEEGSQLCLQ